MAIWMGQETNDLEGDCSPPKIRLDDVISLYKKDVESSVKGRLISDNMMLDTAKFNGYLLYPKRHADE